MRILYASHFDPAGVMAGHRAALRAAGVEAFLALNVDYRGAGVDRECRAPDVVVVCPGIGTGEPRDLALRRDIGVLPLPAEVEQILVLFPRAKRVAYFHGSINTAGNAGAYAIEYRNRGFTVAASTLDYCTWMNAAYLPPALDIAALGEPAVPRADGHTFYVGHTPTNPHVCHTKEFLAAAIDAGVPIRFVTGVRLQEALGVKRICHALFDHLRGAFSVNSLEAAGLGVIPIFGTRPAVLNRMKAEGLAFPPVVVETMDDVKEILQTLKADPALTRSLQHGALVWAQQFTPQATADRLLRFYESL